MRTWLGVALAAMLAVSACGDDCDCDCDEATDTTPDQTVPEDPDGTGDEACTTFAAEPDDTQYGAQFVRDGFTFESIDQNVLPFANDSGFVALQFGDDGLLVSPPWEAASVTMTAGSFASDVTVDAFAADGDSQGQLVLPGNNSVDVVTLTGSITTVQLVGGKNEGVLVDICATPASPEAPEDLVRITFDAFPDGTAITEDTLLAGDEFADLGVTFAAAPVTAYCADVTRTAVRVPGPNVPKSNWLTTARAEALDSCNLVPVEVTFAEAVKLVEVEFEGASVPYRLEVFDASGTLVDAAEETAVLDAGSFFVGSEQDAPIIYRATFGEAGEERAITKVTAITYGR